MSLLALPGFASAVSLGKLELKSYLNGPLRAEIPLTDLRPGDLGELEPGLADEETFQRFGLERNSFLLDMDFELLPGETDDVATILVTTRKIAREPFFSFLLELRGQRESLIREYTVLLDPDTGVRATPQAPASAPVATTAAAPESQPAPMPVEPAPVVAPEPKVYESTTPIVTPQGKPAVSEVIYKAEPVISEGEYGPVRAGETLWGIAAAVRPNDRVTMQQVMWALFSFNESKFSGSISQLHKGVILQVPSEQAMLDVSPAEASALVDSAAQASMPAGPEQLDVEPAADMMAEKPAMDEMMDEPMGMAHQDMPMDDAMMEQDSIDMADEGEMEALPEEPEAAEMPAEPMPVEPPEPELELVEPEAEMPATDEMASAPDEDAAYEELPELPGSEEGDMAEEGLEALPVEEPEVLEEQPLEPIQSSDDSSALSWLLLAGLGVLVVGAGLFVMRRRQSSEEPAPMRPTTPSVAPAAAQPVEDIEPAYDAAQVSDATQDIAEEEPAPMEAEPDLEATAQFDAPLDMTAADLEQSAEAAADEQLAELDLPEEIEEAGGDAEGTLDLGSDTVSLELNEDPLSEADFQLAYGLYDEAALLLERAIDATPDRVELHEKLAETYFAASNADKFRAAAQQLKSKNPSEDIWQRIAIMGQQLCPDDDMFSMDIGDEAGIDLDMGFDEPAEAAPGAEDNSIEFDVGEPAEPNREMSAEPAHEESTVFEADFDDLDLDETDESDEDSLAGLDDLGLEDLESELDAEQPETAELSLDMDEGEDLSLSLDGSDAEEDSGLTDTVAFELGDTQISQTPLGEAPESKPAGEEELSLVGADTDFGVDSGPSDTSEDLSLSDMDLSESTDFDLDDSQGLGADAGLELELEEPAAEATDFDLGEAAGEPEAPSAGSALELDAETTSFDLGDDTELSLEDVSLDEESTGLELEAEPATAGGEGELQVEPPAESTDLNLGEGTDFDLGTASSGEETDFDLGEVTDFDLGDESTGETTDFDLGEETDFNLGDGDGDDLGGLTLDDLDAEGTDFDLGEAGDDSAGLDLGGDTGEISDGDEPGTKLDLATAYVEMGEADMARSLLEEVLDAGTDEQKTKAQELLNKL